MLTLIYVLAGLAGVTLLAWLALAIWLMLQLRLRAGHLKEADNEHE